MLFVDGLGQILPIAGSTEEAPGNQDRCLLLRKRTPSTDLLFSLLLQLLLLLYLLLWRLLLPPLPHLLLLLLLLYILFLLLLLLFLLHLNVSCLDFDIHVHPASHSSTWLALRLSSTSRPRRSNTSPTSSPARLNPPFPPAHLRVQMISAMKRMSNVTSYLQRETALS